MKALEMLLGNTLYKNIAVKREMEHKVHRQDAVVVVPSLDSLASESKSEVVEGQVSCRCLLLGHLSPFCYFFHLPMSLTLAPFLSHRIMSCLSNVSSSVGKVLFSASLDMKNMVRAVT